MNTRNLVLAVTSALLLTVSGGIAAPQKKAEPVARQAAAKQPAKIPAAVSRGAIVSIDANRLVISHRKNGKPEELSFALNPETTRKGNLAVGTRVAVHYRMQNNERLATSIQGMDQSSAEAKPKKGFVSVP